MKLQYYLFALVIVCVSACHSGARHNLTTDTLAYTYKIIKQRADDCGDKPDSACTVAIVKYPIFKNKIILNDSIQNRLFNLFWPDSTIEADTALEKYAFDFINVYEQSENDPSVKGKVFTLNSFAKIMRQDSSLLTLKIGGYLFQGGAHGSTEDYFLNWDTKADRYINLSDLFIKDYKDKLTAIADTIFRKDENISDTASLAYNYFFKDNRFALNNNFLITPTGLLFLYNQYEIKPYVYGQTELLIPYTKIKSLLLPRTVIAQYLK